MTVRPSTSAPARPLAALLAALVVLPLGLAVVTPSALADGGAPDLRVESVSWVPNNPEAGQNVTFHAVILNAGNATAGNSTVTFDVANRSVGLAYTGVLEAGQSVNLTSNNPWVATLGNHTVLVRADHGNLIAESNETNNERTATLTVTNGTDLPDLVITDIDMDPLFPQAGDVVVFNVTVANVGAGAAEAVEAHLSINGGFLGAGNQGPLAPGGSFSFTASWIGATAGNHTATATADPNHFIAEANEENNSHALSFSVGGNVSVLPDLRLDDVRIQPQNPRPGDEVTFLAYMTNIGEASTSGFYYVRLRLEGGAFDHAGAVAIQAPGQNTSISACCWTATAGQHLLEVELDTYHTVQESDETNNEGTASFLVGNVTPPPPKPDLLVSSVSLEPRYPQAGQAVTLVANLVNVGPGTAGPYHARLQLDGNVLVQDEPVGTHPEGQAREVRVCCWTATEGNHILEVQADVFGEVDEGAEANNGGGLRFNVGATTDLVLERLRTIPADPVPGQEARLAALVRNEGPSAAGPFHVALSLQGGSTSSSEHVLAPGLSPGAEVEVSGTPFLVRAGFHFLSAFADSRSEVLEREELSNNYRSASATFGHPDLRVLEVGILGGDLAPGEQGRFRARVLNEGDLGTFADITFRLDDGHFGVARGYLQPGEARTFESPYAWQAWPGAHVVAATTRADEVEFALEDNYGEHVFDVLRPDPAIAGADIVVTKRQLQTDLVGVTNPLAGADIAVTLRNLGEGRTWRHGLHANVAVCHQPLAHHHTCESLGNWTFWDPVAAGATRRIDVGWSTFGKVGDFEVCVRLRYDAPQARYDNDAACAATFVLLGGAGLGGYDATRLRVPSVPTLPLPNVLPAPPGPGHVHVNVSAGFSPANLTVQAGQNATWHNHDLSANHTATAYDGGFDYALSPGEQRTHVFPTAGTYAYYCRYHGFEGSVEVLG